jgi:hypothetical protein
MENKKIEWGMEAVQLGSEVANLASGVGIPGIGLIGKFAQGFYNRYMISRFDNFCNNVEIDEELIQKIQDNENYSNCFYSVLETVRKTHSKLGLTALALLYKDHWDNAKILTPAMRSFSEISDEIILAFISLYESIPEDKNYLELSETDGKEKVFHHLYEEAVELIGRGFFVQSAYSSMHANMPIQGMKFDHTDLYYRYCVRAKEFV